MRLIKGCSRVSLFPLVLNMFPGEEPMSANYLRNIYEGSYEVALCALGWFMHGVSNWVDHT